MIGRLLKTSYAESKTLNLRQGRTTTTKPFCTLQKKRMFEKINLPMFLRDTYVHTLWCDTLREGKVQYIISDLQEREFILTVLLVPPHCIQKHATLVNHELVPRALNCLPLSKGSKVHLSITLMARTGVSRVLKNFSLQLQCEQFSLSMYTGVRISSVVSKPSYSLANELWDF